MSPFRRVPTNEESASLDCPFGFDKNGSPKLLLDGSAAWIHFASPLGIYYVHATDLHLKYKNAFCDLIWVLHKLRRRFVTFDMLDPRSKKQTYVKSLREALARLECLMPLQWCTICVHLLQHACSVLQYTGPPHATWNFGYERWIQIAKKLIKATKDPIVTLLNGIVEHEWTMFQSFETTEDLEGLLTPPLSWLPSRVVQYLGAGKNVVLGIKPNHPCIPSKYNDWRLIFDFLLNEDPLFSVIGDEYKRCHPAWKKIGMLVEIWKPNTQSLLTMIAAAKEKQINVTSDQLMKLLTGPDRNAVEYKRMSVNGIVFVTGDFQKSKGRRSRNICFYVNSKQRNQFLDPKIPNDQIRWPIAAIERILLVKSTPLLSHQKIYKLLRIQNHAYQAAHPTQLPHVQPVLRKLTVRVQPIVDAMCIKPYNIALWPANAHALTDKFVAVWIDPQHGDTC